MAAESLTSESNGFSSSILPSMEFSLVDLEFERSQGDQVQFHPRGQQSDDNFEELEETDDGVNIVVKSTYWWCKDCNVKQKFGYGESLEAHLQSKHSIANKLEEKSSLEAWSAQASIQEATVSDVITSVYTIPSDTLTIEDQAVDTLIVFDDSTTVQVVTKPSEDKCLFSASAKPLENPFPDASQNTLKLPVYLETSESSQPVRSASEDILTQLKPIPVILALPPSNQLLSSDFTESAAAITGSSALTRSQASHQRFASKLTNFKHVSDKQAHSLVPKNGKKTRARNLIKSESCFQTSPETAESTNVSKLRACRVQLKKLSSEELKEIQLNEESDLMASGSKRRRRLPVKLEQFVVKFGRRKDMHDSRNKSRASGNKSPNLSSFTSKASSNTVVENQVCHGQNESVKKRQAKHDTNLSKASSINECITRSGTYGNLRRKIRKPARYLTGSESEGEDDRDDSFIKPTTSKSGVEKDDDFSWTPSRQPKRRKSSLNPAESEQQQNLAKPVKKGREEKFSCENCDRKFKFEHRLNTHLKLYTGQTMQQCTVCDLKLHNLDLLNVHIYHVHQTQESTSCITCGLTLGSKRNLLNHLLTHPNSKGQTIANLIKDSCATHQCTVCDEAIVKGEGRVERHYLTHSRPSSHSCQKCKRSFRHKSELYDHLKEHGESGEVLLQSTLRNYLAGKGVNSSFRSQVESLDDQSEHRVIMEEIIKFEKDASQSSSNQITVTFIPSKFGGGEVDLPDGTSSAKQSMRPPFYCQQCGKQFRSKKLLYQHLRSHGPVESSGADVAEPVEEETTCQPIDLEAGIPFGIPCSVVNTGDLEDLADSILRSYTTTQEGLMVPSQMHYTCALCERGFELEDDAKQHIRRFRNQRTILLCNLCPRKFHNLDLFNVHYIYIHQPEGDALCMTCNKEYKNKGDFLTHLGNSQQAHPLSFKLGFKTFMQYACGTVMCSTCKKKIWNYPTNIANHTKLHKNYPCPICQQGLPYKYAFLIHLQAHTNSKNLNLVSELSQGEVEQSEMAELVDKIHNIINEVESSTFVEHDEKFVCALCESEVIRQRKNIHKHLDLHARKVLLNIREGRYFCHECGEDLVVTDQNILDHMTLHGQSVQFVCVFCFQTFESFDEFKEHELKKHWLNMYFEKNVCEICGKGLVCKRELKKHVKLHAEKQGHFPCTSCKQTFRFESKLRVHMAKHNSARNSFACQFCGKLYMTKISLQRHEQVDHIGKIDFKHKCRLCDAQFINATHLRDHVTNKHSGGNSYACPVCGMGFQYLSTCNRHKRVAHGADTPYVCMECGSKFPQKKDLQHHMVIHTGFNPFECKSCHKSFSLERTMREHVDFVHNGIIKFVCTNCGSKFPRKRNLTRHMSTCRARVTKFVEVTAEC